jgi:argininosuccinate lyase
VPREEAEAALDPAESVAMRDSRGGPAPEAVADHLDRADETLTADRSAVADRREAVVTAADTLETEVDRYV